MAALVGPESASTDGAGPPESAAISVSRPEGRTRTPATTHAGPRLDARRTDSGGIAAVMHLLIKRRDICVLPGTDATIPARPLGAACAGRRETGRVCGTRRR